MKPARSGCCCARVIVREDDRQGEHHEAHRRPTQSLRPAGLHLHAQLLLRGRDRDAAHRGRADPQGRPAGGLAREDRRAAHRVRRAHLQRGVPHPGAASAPARAAPAVFRRGGLRPPVQAQRQGGIRGRRLAMAPGLRHLGARRRHAGGARDEHRGVPRRGDADQRPAAAHSRQPRAGRARRPATTSSPPPIRSGRSTRRR